MSKYLGKISKGFANSTAGNGFAHPGQTGRNKADISVWTASCNADFNYCEAYAGLPEAEKQRANRFAFEKDRNLFVLSRHTLRVLLGKYLNLPPAAIILEYGRYGKPRLPAGQPLHFNLSHSGDTVVYAFTRFGEVGIDIEQLNPDVRPAELGETVFSAEEIEVLKAQKGNGRLRTFYTYWTRKEALIKATGYGLSFPQPLKGISVISDRITLNIPGEHNGAGCSKHWSLKSFSPKKNILAAVASSAPEPVLGFYQYPLQA